MDDYVELMYDDETKVRGTGMVLQLCTQVANLEVLIQNQVSHIGKRNRECQSTDRPSDGTYLSTGSKALWLAATV